MLSLLEDAKAGRPLARPTESASPLSPSAAQNLFSSTTVSSLTLSVPTACKQLSLKKGRSFELLCSQLVTLHGCNRYVVQIVNVKQANICLQPPLSPQKPRSPRSPQSPSRRTNSTQLLAEVRQQCCWSQASAAGCLLHRAAHDKMPSAANAVQLRALSLGLLISRELQSNTASASACLIVPTHFVLMFIYDTMGIPDNSWLVGQGGHSAPVLLSWWQTCTSRGASCRFRKD